MNIGNKIKEIRLSRGVTQRYILSKLNKHRSWLSQVESGHTDINAVDLMRIAEVLNVPIEEFFLPSPLTESKNANQDTA